LNDEDRHIKKLRSDIAKSTEHLKKAISKEHINQTASRLRNLEERAISEKLIIDDFERTFPDLAPLEEFLENLDAEIEQGHVDSLRS
jgi:hypothetical protein